MSVYSGFCTRKQEKDYNFCLQKMMFILAKRCVKAVHNIPVDATRFAGYFGKLLGMMIRLEEGKYQPPKFSDSLWELADALGIRDLESLFSENQSSMMDSAYFNNMNPQRGISSKRTTQNYNLQGQRQPPRIDKDRLVQQINPVSQRSRRLIHKQSEEKQETNESGQVQPQSQSFDQQPPPPRMTKNYVINYKYYYNQSPPQKPGNMPPIPNPPLNKQNIQPLKQIVEYQNKTNQNPINNFTLKEKEQDFLKRFEQSRMPGPLPVRNKEHLRHIDEESDSLLFSNQSPNKGVFPIGQNQDVQEFENPEDTDMDLLDQ